jgi:hypothetical protein
LRLASIKRTKAGFDIDSVRRRRCHGNPLLAHGAYIATDEAADEKVDEDRNEPE